jgi:type VI secretion system protein ImpH
VRLLQNLRPDAPRVGFQGPPGAEAVRFRPTLDLAFAPSDVARIRELPSSPGGPRFEVSTTFLGLYGASSPLPTFFTEELLGQDEESLEREFLDLFHHRLISLFYRVWEKYRYAVSFSPDGKDYYSERLLTLLGLSRESIPPDHRAELLRLIALAGLVTQIPHSAASLRAALSTYFEGVGVRIDSCVGQRLPIPPDQHNRLGRENSTLGRDLSLGERVYDQSCTFRVGLGPLGLAEFLTFLPPGAKIRELRELVDLKNGDALDYEVELELREAEIPPLALSGPHAMLGWCSWLGHRPGMDGRVRFFVKGWLHGRG